MARNPKRHLQPPAIRVELPGKAPRIGVPIHEIRDRKPVWRFSLMDMDGRWGWHAITPGDFCLIQGRLKSYETMPWKTIECQHSCGQMLVADIGKDARDRLVALGRDIDVLYKLRITTAGRVWGVREEHALNLLWWDPNHEVYPMDPAGNSN
jgi:hypothetical protein